MAKFVWNTAADKPKEFLLKGPRVTIGRDSGADMSLDEPSVSTRHAMAIVLESSVTLHDLDSRNGTWVNGERIQLATLKNGDVVEFGRLKATFVDQAQMAASAPRPAGAQAYSATTPAGVHTSVLTGSAAEDPLAQTIAGKAGAPAGVLTPDFSELDRVLGNVREQRKQEASAEDVHTVKVKAEWQLTLQYAAALKAKLANEPRVRFFDISERRNEIVMRVEKSPGQPLHMMQITVSHPDRRTQVFDSFWLRQTGGQDQRFEDHTNLMREVVASLASLLA